MSNMMDYVNYEKLIDDSRELLVTDKWDITIDKAPEAVYYPGEDVIKFRVKEVSGLSMGLFEHSPLDTKIRGIAVPPQAGQVELLNQDVTVTFIDYEDQTILAFLSDWIFKCCDPVNQVSYPSRLLRADLTFTRLNISGEPVRRYKMKSGILKTPNYADEFSGERELVGDGVTVSIFGTVFPPELLNLS